MNDNGRFGPDGYIVESGPEECDTKISRAATYVSLSNAIGHRAASLARSSRRLIWALRDFVRVPFYSLNHYAFAMTFRFVDFSQAKLDRDAGKTVLVSVAQIPSPWSESVKGLLHLQGREFSVLRLDPRNQELHAWAGSPSAPALLLPGKSGITQAVEIIEALQETGQGKSLLPADQNDRSAVLDLVRELVDPGGLAWNRRLMGIHGGLTGQGGFVEPIAQYLGKKYGYEASKVPKAQERLVETLGMLTRRLRKQKDANMPYLFGREISAADVYCAVTMAIFAPLDERQCPMDPAIRKTFEERDETTGQALDPILLEHRDFIYRHHLELPVRL